MGKRITSIAPGNRFGRLVARVVVREGNSVKWECLCDCGGSTRAEQHNLATGKTKSCGCLRAEKNATRHLKHKLRYSRAYKSWAGMKQRCTNPNNPDWSYYGGRGIAICDRWLTFENFYEDMSEPEEGMTIDRINVDGNYEPTNCRWATRQEQRTNQRRVA